MGVHVLLLGASGVFGSRLAEGLAGLSGLTLTLAARKRAPLELLRARLSTRARAVLSVLVVERAALDPDMLRQLGVTVVIDAAGPFAGNDYGVILAAASAGCHVIDLADSRAYVAGIGAVDAAARDAGIAVIAGASTTPALSHAVLDAVTAGWRRIDRVDVAISPGNRTPRGPAVVASILSYAGRPLQVFEGGGWSTGRGWGGTKRLLFPDLGRRPAALCDTPDLDLLVARYRPSSAASFRAGLELGILHYGLAAASWLVRCGLLRSLSPFARPAHAAARLLLPFGSAAGGMVAEAVGIDAEGRPARAAWSLTARHGLGPYVPTLPALALIDRWLREGPPAPGARACVGMLSLSELQPFIAERGLSTATVHEGFDPAGPFAHACGAGWSDLPAATRAVHAPSPVLVLDGEADIDGAQNAIGRLIAWAFGFPGSARAAPLRVALEREGADEIWTRIYPDRTMRSRLAWVGGDRIEETFGPFAFRQQVVPDEGGLSLRLVGGRCGLIPLPAWLLPGVAARESAGADGSHQFDVSISLPIVGRLVHYRGRLTIPVERASA